MEELRLLWVFVALVMAFGSMKLFQMGADYVVDKIAQGTGDLSCSQMPKDKPSRNS